MDIEIEMEDCSVFWSPPPTPPPFEISEDDARRLARFRRIPVEEVEAMERDEVRQLEREYIEWFNKRLTRYINRVRDLEARNARIVADLEEEQEEEEKPKEKFYSIPGYCRSKDPQNRIRKNLHNLMHFYSTFPIMITFMDNIFEDDIEEDSDFEEEIEDCSVFWSPPPTPPPFEMPENARRIANFHGFTLEELEAMRPDEIRQLQKEWFRDRIRRLHRRIMELEAQRDRLLAAAEEEGEKPKEKFYSMPGNCGSKDPQNRIRKNLHNLMYFYSTFPIMM